MKRPSTLKLLLASTGLALLFAGQAFAHGGAPPTPPPAAHFEAPHVAAPAAQHFEAPRPAPVERSFTPQRSTPQRSEPTRTFTPSRGAGGSVGGGGRPPGGTVGGRPPGGRPPVVVGGPTHGPTHGPTGPKPGGPDHPTKPTKPGGPDHPTKPTKPGGPDHPTKPGGDPGKGKGPGDHPTGSHPDHPKGGSTNGKGPIVTRPGHGVDPDHAKGVPTTFRGDRPDHVPPALHRETGKEDIVPYRWHGDHGRPGLHGVRFEFIGGYWHYGHRVHGPFDRFWSRGWVPTTWFFIDTGEWSGYWWSEDTGYVEAPPVEINEPITITVQKCDVPMWNDDGSPVLNNDGSQATSCQIFYVTAYWISDVGAYGYSDPVDTNPDGTPVWDWVQWGQNVQTP